MNRPIILSLIFFSLTLGLGIGLVWPKYQELVILEKRNEEKRMEVQTKSQYLQDLKKAKERLKNYQIQLAKIDSALPPDPNLAALFDFLQKASSQQGLVLTGISSFHSSEKIEEAEEFPEEIERLKETEMSSTFSGEYSSLKNFLSILEKSARLIEVEEISFSTPKKGGPLDFKLKIKVYSY